MLEEHPLTSPELTGDWEKRLGDIEHGDGDREEFMKGIERLHRADGRADRGRSTRRSCARSASSSARARAAAPETGEIIRENSQGLRLHELEEPRGDGLRLRDLEARRRPHADARGGAPADRGGTDPGGAVRLPEQGRQTFSRPSRLERRGQGRVRASRHARKPRSPLPRNNRESLTLEFGAGGTMGTVPLEVRGLRRRVRRFAEDPLGQDRKDVGDS